MLQMLILSKRFESSSSKMQAFKYSSAFWFCRKQGGMCCLGAWDPPTCLLASCPLKDQEAEVLIVYGGLELVYLCRTPKKLIPASGHEYSMCVTPERKFVPASSNSVNDALRRLRQAAASYKNTPSIFLHTSPEEEHELQQVLHLSYFPSEWSCVPSEWSRHTRNIATIFLLCNDRQDCVTYIYFIMIDDFYSLFHPFTNMLMTGSVFQESQQEP